LATDDIGDERDEAAKGRQRAGRVAEDLVCVAITTGAESGMRQLVQIERQMVGRCGTSEAIGLVATLRTDGLPAGA
jgi:ATP-dependent Zn protease